MTRRLFVCVLVLGLGACKMTIEVGPLDDPKKEAIDTTAMKAYGALPMKPPCKDKPCDI